MRSITFSKIAFLVAVVTLFFGVESTYAATLRLSPETGVYTAGSTFTVQVLMNTQGKPVNAADAQVGYNPNELAVVSVNRGSSVFNLWTLEPTFSASAGTISFGGGSPTGYTGASGNIMTITFRALGSGASKVSFKTGSILAADGLGTNVLTAMNGGTYSIEAKSNTPPPEYVPPANTPTAPSVVSSTHSDEDRWYRETNATVSWLVPPGVTAVRTLVDSSPSSVPTKTYEEPIGQREIPDLPQGTSYFHVQFKNADGWGRIAHFRINIDSEEPESFTISEEDVDAASPKRTFIFEVTDVSPISSYSIQLDGDTPFEFKDTEGLKRYTIEALTPGSHTIVVEARDSAGNSRVATHTFTVTAFEAPLFSEYPERLTTGVVPAFKGTTRPNVEVIVTVSGVAEENHTYITRSNESGEFVFVPDDSFSVGVYEITAIARGENGAQSEPSVPVRIVVEEPGYMVIGTFAVKVLSVIVPLVALIIVLIFGAWFLWWRLHRWQRKVMRETIDAEEKLAREFDTMVASLNSLIEKLKESRKNKLTKTEESLIHEVAEGLRTAQERIRKELTDIEDIVE